MRAGRPSARTGGRDRRLRRAVDPPQPVGLEVGEPGTRPARPPRRSLPARASAAPSLRPPARGRPARAPARGSGRAPRRAPSRAPRRTPPRPPRPPPRAARTADQRRHRQRAPRQRLAADLRALAGGHHQLEAGEVDADDHTNVCSHNCGWIATARCLHSARGRRSAQSIVSGPSADPLRNWRTNGFSEANIFAASPASTIRPRHSRAMYSPICRAEAMLWVTTM